MAKLKPDAEALALLRRIAVAVERLADDVAAVKHGALPKAVAANGERSPASRAFESRLSDLLTQPAPRAANEETTHGTDA